MDVSTGKMRYAFSQRLAGIVFGMTGLLVPVTGYAQNGLCDAEPVPCCRVWRSENQLKEAMPSFGLQIWPTGFTGSPMAMERLAALKPRTLRFALGPNWRRQDALRADITDAEIDRFVSAGFDARNATGEFETILEAQRRTGAKLHLVIWEPPPLPGESTDTRTRRLQSANVPLAARFLVSLLDKVAARGLSLDAVEIANEPDGDWNIAIAPVTYLALVRAVRAEAARRGIALPKIAGPGTSTIRALRAYLRQPAIAQAIIDSVDILSVHAWDNANTDDRFSELDGLQDDLKRLQRRPELVVTEYGLARPDPTDNSDRMNVKRRAPDSIADTPFYASLVIRDLLRLYAGGAGAVMMWEFQDQDWGSASFGLLNEKGERRPIYDMTKALAERLAAEQPLRFRRTDAKGLFVAHSAHFDSYWSVNAAAAETRVVFPDGVRATTPPALGFAACAGAPGIAMPPFSLNGSQIVRP
jgi:hypothetical protein